MKKILKGIKTSVLVLLLTCVIGLIIILTVVIHDTYSQPQPVAQQPTVAPPPPTADELLRLVNEERAKVGVAPLKINLDVQKSAQLKADDMHKNHYFGHIMPSTGKVLNKEMDMLLSTNCIDSSENIYKQIPHATSVEAVEWWMHSPPHKKAELDPRYESVGFGISNNQIVVQHFCDER